MPSVEKCCWSVVIRRILGFSMVNLRKIAASMGKKTHLIPVNVVNSHYIILLKRDKERRDKEHIRKQIDIFFIRPFSFLPYQQER